MLLLNNLCSVTHMKKEDIMSNTQLLEVLGTETFDVQEDLFAFDTTDTTIVASNDDPDTRFKSWSLCTPGCARTGSFNSYCC